MKTNSFKGVAYQVLQEAKKPLHCKEITKIARNKKWLTTEGKTPEQTMCALLYADIKSQGRKSKFEKVKPGFFRINPKFKETSIEIVVEDKVFKISECSTKQKGDIAEARIAELITLYGNKSLACYKPLSDDEGIDLIVKDKGSSKTIFVQVKSRFSHNPEKGVYVSTAKTSTVKNIRSMMMIFCFFDITKGDIWDYLWLIPASKFIKKASRLEGGIRLGFVSGTRRGRKSNKWNKYLIDRRDLPNKIIEQMKRT
jgi:hypothetical protein